jgi:hypothetical protein
LTHSKKENKLLRKARGHRAMPLHQRRIKMKIINQGSKPLNLEQGFCQGENEIV